MAHFHKAPAVNVTDNQDDHAVSEMGCLL